MTGATDLLRRHLRQRKDLGEGEIHLEAMTPAEVLSLLAQINAAGRDGVRADAQRAEPSAAARIDPLDPRERESGAPAAGPTVGELVQVGGLAELRQTALGCPRCRLAETRRHVVFGEGSETAELMVVGEAPGGEEDRTGRPFVGRAGKLLDLLLASVGLPRDSVYICNVLKCRPPGNRDPEADEIEACSPYLARQIELIGPRVILTVGTFSSQTLLGLKDPMSRLRGRVHEYQGRPLVATYHPAAVLRNPGWLRPVWDDLQRLRVLLDGDVDPS